MAVTFTSIGEAVTFFLGLVGDVVDTVVGNPLLLIGFGATAISLAVGLYKRLV